MSTAMLSLSRSHTFRINGRPTMIGAIRSEMARLTRRSFAGTGALVVATLTVLVTAITFFSATNSGGGNGDGFGPGFGLVLAAPGGIVVSVTSAASILGIVVLAYAATAVGGDYSTGFIRLLVQAEPRRWRLIVGKTIALAGFTVGAAALAVVVGAAVSPIAAGLTGVSTAAWMTSLPGTLASTFLNLSLGLSVWAMIGFVIAVVTRSTAAAIAGGIGYVLVVENLLGLLNADLARWLPGSVITSLVAGGDGTLEHGAAGALAGGYIVLGLVVSLVVFQRRDISA